MMNKDTVSLAAQRAYSATVGRGAMAIAITGTSLEAGASDFAMAVAIAGSDFGKRVLLLRASHANADNRPCEPDLESVREMAVRKSDCLSVLEVPHGTRLHSILNDGMRLSAVLASWSDAFDAIIIDCPPFGVASPAIYTPLTALAADAVLMVAMPGTLPSKEFDEICQWLAESGAELSALVLNDHFNPTLGQEIIREAGRLKRIWPRFPDFVARRIARYPLLNRTN